MIHARLLYQTSLNLRSPEQFSRSGTRSWSIKQVPTRPQPSSCIAVPWPKDDIFRLEASIWTIRTAHLPVRRPSCHTFLSHLHVSNPSISTTLKPYPSCPPENFLLTTRVTAKMPTHFSFAFGVGNLFNFQFNYGRHREPSPARCDHRSGITDWDMAKVGAFSFP